jgi:ribosomal protein S4
MRLLRTVEIAKQFIKHGAVFINYRKILSPSYIVKPGDSICIHVPFKKKKCHRLYDPLYVRRSLHGLYRQNTGRQSLIAIEKHQTFLKASSNLNIVSK